MDVDKHRVQPVRSTAGSSRTRELRASDAEREAVADSLSFHCAAGRLAVDELEQRLAVALSASTVGELDQLLRDLPAKRPTAVSATPRAQGNIKPGLPGLRSFRQLHELRTGRVRAFREALLDILPVMVAAGYDVIGRVENELLVFQRHDERIVVAFSESRNGGTRLVVQGTARRPVRKAFANLAAD